MAASGQPPRTIAQDGWSTRSSGLLHGYQGVMPRANSTYGSPTMINNWLVTIMPYLHPTLPATYTNLYQTDPLFVCPRCTYPRTGDNTYQYAMNWLIDMGSTSPTNFKLSQFYRPDQIIIFGDKDEQVQSPWLNLSTEIGTGFGSGTEYYPPALSARGFGRGGQGRGTLQRRLCRRTCGQLEQG